MFIELLHFERQVRICIKLGKNGCRAASGYKETRKVSVELIVKGLMVLRAKKWVLGGDDEC